MSHNLCTFFQIVEILHHLVANNVAKVHEDAPLKFIQLIQVLRVASLENVEAIWSQFKARPEYRYELPLFQYLKQTYLCTPSCAMY